MAQEAHREGRLPPRCFTASSGSPSGLTNYLIEPAFPSLLHGDLWTGNVLVRRGAHRGLRRSRHLLRRPEIELAFATLFGTFGDAFFEAYVSSMPLEPGFHELRAGLYNLYPRLVHVRLFGSGYLAGDRRDAARLGF